MQWIRRAGKVLYLFADPVPVAWITKVNPSAQSLEGFYAPAKDRQRTYEEITEEILRWVRRDLDVCVVLYGHPGVFVGPSHAAVRRAREEGFPARMLPGISAEDCLFADLGVDPGAWGCQSYEATSFLLYRRSFDTATPLVLWQVAGIGVRQGATEPSVAGLRLLAEFLQDRYGPDHEVVLYQASPYPLFDPVVRRLPLRDLPGAGITAMSSLYVPPKGEPAPDPEMHARLELPLPDPVPGVTAQAGGQAQGT
jgi:uncharacterized protein YabN with tetrapyrrole methylase and pyrophosphatase domain